MLTAHSRLAGTMWPRLAAYWSTSRCDRAESPFMLASSVALVVLSSAAEIGGGEGLLRGHGDGWLYWVMDREEWGIDLCG